MVFNTILNVIFGGVNVEIPKMEINFVMPSTNQIVNEIVFWADYAFLVSYFMAQNRTLFAFNHFVRTDPNSYNKLFFIRLLEFKWIHIPGVRQRVSNTSSLRNAVYHKCLHTGWQPVLWVLCPIKSMFTCIHKMRPNTDIF